MKKQIATATTCLVIGLSPINAKAEPVSLTLLAIAAFKATAGYLTAKSVIAYGATKILVTKAGMVIVKKQTITLATGATKVAVIGVAANAMLNSFAEAGVPLEENEESVKYLSERAIDLFSNGETQMQQKICTSPDGDNHVVPDWMDCGAGQTSEVTLDLEEFVAIQE